MAIGDCKDRSLAAAGRRRIEWADENMPVLADIRAEWEKTKPLAGVRIAACMHVTTETANLMRTLKTGGAEVALAASNPLSTQDDVAAALNEEYGIPTFAIRGEDNETYYRHIRAVLDTKPHITMDDGADLVTTLYRERKDLLAGVIGGTEETTTGVIRLRAMAEDGELPFPVVAVNDARTKHMFDNRYGTGQSTIDGILRATNYMLAGSTFVVAGFGWCGRGIAARARGMGADVIVVEVDPLRALEAVMEGYRVMPMRDAAKEGHIFVTATGNRGVINGDHFALMKDGATLANAGHFDVEIDIPALAAMAKERREARPNVQEFVLEDGRRIRLLAEGRLVNLGAAEGHPAQVMDMSFANQALSALWLLENKGKLERQVYSVPEDIDAEVARRKLDSMGVRLERLTPAQEEYLSTWRLGT
ncbi:MAG: adenosylhomocysteinase [Limnochordales bacterium]|nr:MAG: adenosylhomocysteinase [Bacillota bacterium]